MSNAPFIDWVTVRQSHKVEKPLPLLFKGVHSYHTAEGLCVSERLRAQSLRGSWETSILVQCDGSGFLVSGNVGRFGRPDNVFNLDWSGTKAALQRICDAVSVPRFSGPETVWRTEEHGQQQGGAVVSRLDITRNFATGSNAQSIAFLRHCSGLNVSRAKRGIAGDESVWWSNSRRMLKVYRKGPELLAHGMPRNHPLVEWCFDNGIVRFEVSMKRRLLNDLGMSDIDSISESKLRRCFHDETEFLTKFDSSDDPDLLVSIPARSRAYAAAWLAGQDLSEFCSRATLSRHARVLKEYGINILTPRNVAQFPTKVRVIELEPVAPPAWYEWHKEDAA